MKHLLMTACCLVAVTLTAANPRTERLVELARESGLYTEDQISKLLRACSDAEEAEANLAQVMKMMGLDPKPKTKTINADVTDPTILAIRKQVQKTRNRFEYLKRTINKWGPSTNLTARAAGASFQDKLNAARKFEKHVKEIQKAAKKDGKNLGKLRKDLEKYFDKAETEGFKELCRQLLDLLPVPNEE